MVKRRVRARKNSPHGTAAIKQRAKDTELRIALPEKMVTVRGLHREAKLAIVAKLALMGFSRVEIAERLDVSVHRVNAYLREIRQIWLETTQRSYEEMKATEVARVNEIERQQWEEINLLENSTPEEKRQNWWIRRYDAAYQRIMWCIEQRCKLLGLYVPQEVLNWKTEAVQAGYDPDALYRVLVHQISYVIDGAATPVDTAAPAVPATALPEEERDDDLPVF